MIMVNHSCRFCFALNVMIMMMVMKMVDVEGLSFSLSSPSCLSSPSSSSHPLNKSPSRRQAIKTLIASTAVATTATTVLFPPLPASARAPGSKDISASIQQIQDAARALKQMETNWSQYAVIDAEGRAGSTDGARRILGGIAPQAGSAAIDAAKNTPLYRIDVAFVTVRKAVLEDGEQNQQWTGNLDLELFEELADRIIYETQKADGNFYGVLFAQKGTKMINDIFMETLQLVKQGTKDLEDMVQLLKESGAPDIQSP